jgi:hypothetical protein
MGLFGSEFGARRFFVTNLARIAHAAYPPTPNVGQGACLAVDYVGFDVTGV